MEPKVGVLYPFVLLYLYRATFFSVSLNAAFACLVGVVCAYPIAIYELMFTWALSHAQARSPFFSFWGEKNSHAICYMCTQYPHKPPKFWLMHVNQNVTLKGAGYLVHKAKATHIYKIWKMWLLLLFLENNSTWACNIRFLMEWTFYCNTNDLDSTLFFWQP